MHKARGGFLVAIALLIAALTGCPDISSPSSLASSAIEATKGNILIRLLREKGADDLSRVDFEVSGSKIPTAKKYSLLKNLSLDALETRFSDLPPGKASVSAKALDKDQKVIAQFSAQTEIAAGSNLLQFQWTSSKADASPTPAESSSLTVRILPEVGLPAPASMNLNVTSGTTLFNKGLSGAQLNVSPIEVLFENLLPGTASVDVASRDIAGQLVARATVQMNLEKGKTILAFQLTRSSSTPSPTPGPTISPTDSPTAGPTATPETPAWIQDKSGILPGQNLSLSPGTPFSLKGIALDDRITTLSFNNNNQAYLAFINPGDGMAWLDGAWQGSNVYAASLESARGDFQTPAEKSAARRSSRPIRLGTSSSRRVRVRSLPQIGDKVSIKMYVSSANTVKSKPTTVKKADSYSSDGKIINFAILVDDDDLAVVNDSVLTNLSAEIKGNILPKVTNKLGEAPPGNAAGLALNDDGTLYFCISREVDGDDSGTLGFFAAIDLTDDIESNRKNIVFIAPGPLASPGKEPQVYSTVAHEYAHLVFFWQRAKVLGATVYQGVFNNQQETWLTEGFSTLTTALCGYGPDDANGGANPQADPVLLQHVYNYINAPQRTSLFPFTSYGMSFLFTHYLQDRYGNEVLKEVMQSQKWSSSYSAVSDVLEKHGSNFYQFFRDFAIALLLDGTLSESATYRIGEVNLRGTYRLRGQQTTFYGPSTIAPGQKNPAAFTAKPWGIGFLGAYSPSGLTLSVRNGARVNGVVLVPNSPLQ